MTTEPPAKAAPVMPAAVAEAKEAMKKLDPTNANEPPAGDAEVVQSVSFLQMTKKQSPGFKSYNNQSGAIFGILE
jgi:hypothetical protein